MTDLLQQAIIEINKLPQAEQDAFAQFILDELASERRWQQAFANSADKLAKMAEEVLAEHR